MPDALADLMARLPDAMLADRLRLRRLASAVGLRRREGRPGEGALEALVRAMGASVARRARRAACVPRPEYPSDLPIVQRKDEIARAIAGHQVCVICGETGSGKTTQLPKICLELGRGVGGLIGHTQPRRIAARSVAARIASELGAELGGAVGYKVRFGDRTGPDTYVKLMTDGILLAETQGDRSLEQYDTIIIDEAHERSLNIDFLLGYLRQLLPVRPDLKVIITSATIDPGRFSRHFGGAPIVEVSGRMYPVEVRYRPPADDDPDERDQERGVLAAVDELIALDPRGGDILVFLAGERGIRQAAKALREHAGTGLDILPLYARLSPAEQQRVFQPHAGRRVVLATNVAETSLTVPGIRYVVDPGLARISRYSHRTKVQRLPIEAISRASAEQRKGRCGRVAPGVCIRLYSEEDLRARDEFTEPEILRTNLASVILQMKALGLGEVEAFPFLEPPDGRMIRDGYDTLHELGALTPAGDLTPLGWRLARLPIDPRLGRMILGAQGENCLREVLIIAAALSVQDPRERPMQAAQAADEAHARFRNEHSDFLALLALWDAYKEQERTLSSGRLRAWCRDHFLSFVRMREWEDVHIQLHALATELGLREAAAPANTDAVHRALLSGLLSNIGTRGETFEYAGTRSGKFHLFPGSGLFSKGPKWVMAAELVQTTRLYARTVAKIQPEWIEPLALHVVKRIYADAHWARETGTVCAFERVTLFGLEIVARRRVQLERIDPPKARAIFIHHALVEGDCRCDLPFLAHNRALLDEVRLLEAKARRRDIAADQGALYSFYDARLPADVCGVSALEKWHHRASRAQPALLRMTRQDATRGDAAEITPDRFPDSVASSGSRLDLGYVLDPGGEADGVSMTVPLGALAQLDPERCEWLVPGQLEEKILALLRVLPKAHRKPLDPMPTLARECAAAIPFAKGSLIDALRAEIRVRRGVDVPRDAWRPRGVPDHLRMLLILTDEHAKELARSRDAAELKERFGARARTSFAAAARAAFDRDGLTAWTFGALRERVEIARGTGTVVGYPALLDRGDSVSLRLLESPEAARDATCAGLRRLFFLRCRDEVLHQVRLLPALAKMRLHDAPFGSPDDLTRDLAEHAVDRVFLADQPEVRTPEEFERRVEKGWNRVGAAVREAGDLLASILERRHEIELRLQVAAPAAFAPALGDVRAQIGALLPRGFLASIPPERLRHLPRYLAAAVRRLDKLANAGLARDTRAMQELAPHLDRLRDAPAPGRPSPAPEPAALDAYRWMVEEFRVSLFAQELGTPQPVSAKRLDEQWAKVIGA